MRIAPEMSATTKSGSPSTTATAASATFRRASGTIAHRTAPVIASSAYNSTSATLPPALGAGLSATGLLLRDNNLGQREGAALLVPINGNKYSAVPLLDFGAQADSGPISGVRRKPWLSTTDAIVKPSPLSRFVSGQEDAWRQYRESAKAALPADGEASQLDPWYVDLFHRHQASRPPIRLPEPDESPDDASIDELPQLDQGYATGEGLPIGKD